jgi:pimeloyl-[acyl-carrier protein] synthase
MTRTPTPSQPAARSPAKEILYNPFLPEFRQNPHPFLKRLRETDPVHFSPLVGVWVLTRYADSLAALKDHEHFSASTKPWKDHERFFYRQDLGQQSPLADVYNRWMLQLDPPDHTRLRALLNKAFTPRVVETMVPRIQRIVDDLLDRAVAKDAGGMDFIADFAYPLPVMVICDMMGIPAEDQDKIELWCRKLLPSFTAAVARETVEETNSTLNDFREYFRDLTNARRKDPKPDLLSGLIAARDQGDRLNDDELFATCILLAFAGHASAVQATANTLVLLLNHPEERAKLDRDPSLIDNAVEESLRFESPLQIVFRTTKQETHIGGKTIPASQMIFISLVAANRDPAQFPEPDRFDITRKENRHIAFGYNIHYCAGAPLGRVEAQVAIATVLKRFPNIRISTDKIEREPSLILRGMRALPVVF